MLKKVCLTKRYVEMRSRENQVKMNIIEKNLPNILHNQTFMTVTTVMLRQIFVYREPDRSFRVVHEGGFNGYFSDPKKVLEVLGDDDDILKVTITFPTLNEIILIYGD